MLINLAIIAYIYDGQEHPIMCKPHGNSKTNLPGFTRKKPSKKVRQRSAQVLVTQAVEEQICSEGGRAVIPEEIKPAKLMIYRSNSRKSVAARLLCCYGMGPEHQNVQTCGFAS